MASSTPTSTPQLTKATFTLRLGDDGSCAEQYFRLPPPNPANPYKLRLVITSGSIASFNPKLYTNLPEENKPFARGKFNAYNFHSDGASDHAYSLSITLPGAFEFYVTYTNTLTGGEEERCKQPGTFVVDPRLALHSNCKTGLLPMDGINLLTIIPKWMPPVKKWGPFFDNFSKTGYNMVHFAPINKRGISNSPYSINDQLSLANDLFSDVKGEDGTLTPLVKSEEEKEKIMIETIQGIHKDHNIFSVTDIVWNHTSCDSLWLQDHPEAGYNLKTAPYLRPAFELDEAIMEFSASLDDPKGQPINMHNDQDLYKMCDQFKGKHFEQLKLYEFYILDVAEEVKKFTEAWNARTPLKEIPKEYEHLGSIDFKARVSFIEKIAVIDPKTYKRFSKVADIAKMVIFIGSICLQFNVGDTLKQIDEFRQLLNEVNLKYYIEYNEDTAVILEQIRNRAKFLRIDNHGPKLGPISRSSPFVDTYFTRLPRNERTKNLHEDELALACNGWIWNADPLVNFAGEGTKAYLRREVIAWGDCVKLRYGDGPKDSPWLWEHQTKYSLKMAKIFHGFRIDNCHSTPLNVASYLLDKAREIRSDLYVFAELFTGSEKKDILFVAKLGINSLIREAMNAWDPTELSRLIHRQGGSPVGSFSIPSHQFPLDMLGHDIGSDYHSIESETDGDFVISVKGSSPHALFMDCTHDNETPHQLRTAVDTLSTAALVAMSSCAIGSVKGYDEIIPRLLDVVGETRKYRLPKLTEGILAVKAKLYPLHAKMASMGYSEIHVNQEHDYISVHRMHPITHDGYLLIARTGFNGQRSEIVHSPIKLRNQNVKLLQCASLNVQSPETADHYYYSHAPADEGTKEDLLPQLRSPTLYHPQALPNSRPRSPFDNSDQYCSINGGCLNGLASAMKISETESFLSNFRVDGNSLTGDFETIITVEGEKFVPGSIVVYRTWMAGCTIDPKSDMVQAIVRKEAIQYPGVLEQLWLSMGMDDKNLGIEIMSQLGTDLIDVAAPWSTSHKAKWIPGLKDCIKRLQPNEINVILYRTAPEERDAIGQSVYDIPGFGPLPYCGLQGFVSVLSPMARNNDLGHPICSNMRQGPWIYDYTLSRLQKYLTFYPGLKTLLDWLTVRIDLVKKLPPAFAPKYFTIVVMCAYEAVKFQALFGNHHTRIPSKSIDKVPSSLDVFAYSCAMTAFQMYGSVKSTGLLPGPYPLPLKSTEQLTPIIPIRGMPTACIAAGLPHFSIEYCRCWGRDIFIAMRGLFIIPGNFEAARTHILAFGSTLNHGLIPNLLDQGIRPRYNARDAVWFWLEAVFDYCRESVEGIDFLEAPIARRFLPLRRYSNPQFGFDKGGEEPPDTDSYIPPNDPRVYMHTTFVAQMCHEILERHFQGIEFREYNAGSGIDHAMRTEGFNISVSINKETGFVQGGNRWNCGTWMDKMGDSTNAGIFGVPATPRDGSAIELVGLLKAVLSYINNTLIPNHSNLWPWKGVSYQDKDGETTFLSYADWETTLQNSFEKSFYIPLKKEDDDKYRISRPDLVNRRGIYKDTFNSATPFADYQMRPNVCIAMVKAPELFSPDLCRGALLLMKENMLGPLGMKTLDPLDWAYRGIYDNSNDSTDPSVAHGFNYHQGPEWVWIFGYFLRAYLFFFTKADGFDESKVKFHINEIQRIIRKHKIFLLDSSLNPFAGLPELTNKDGIFCGPSCPSQAWSTSVMIELVDEMRFVVGVGEVK